MAWELIISPRFSLDPGYTSLQKSNLQLQSHQIPIQSLIACLDLDSNKGKALIQKTINNQQVSKEKKWDKSSWKIFINFT